MLGQPKILFFFNLDLKLANVLRVKISGRLKIYDVTSLFQM